MKRSRAFSLCSYIFDSALAAFEEIQRGSCEGMGRKRKLPTCLFFLTLLFFSVCLVFLAYLQQPEDVVLKDIGRPVGLTPRDTGQRVNVQRDILYFDQEQNKSEKEKVVSVAVVLEETTQTSAAQAASTESEPVKEDTSLCEGPWPEYQDCQAKIDWMEGNWQKDSCYAQHGVDGSKCSFVDYLSLVEHWCPPRPGKVPIVTGKKATINYDFQPLLTALNVNQKFDWLARRMQSIWSEWTSALKQLESIKPFQHTEKRILVHIGALSDKAKFHLAETADHGGPLGELVQWSDLIASLHLLGHQVVYSTEQNSLGSILPPPPDPNNKLGGCPTGHEKSFDVIFTDIVGLKQFKRAVRSKLQHYLCLFKVLDSFGTEPMFNFKPWKPERKYKKQVWGNWMLNPRQFMTMYPHTPDNSFMGFVVGSNRTNSLPPFKKRDTGLVYGKELYMWKGHHDYLDTISTFLNIHATIGTTTQKEEANNDPTVVPGFVTNHGILNHTALVKLLQETKLFIGMGFPFEGPAPLEAIANGCFFINPQFENPLSRDNTDFFKDKPTLRSLSSQNPYTERFIGSPYVYTVNTLSVEEVDKAVRDMLTRESPPPHIPYEYTYEGMLERVTVYLEHQDFCSHKLWPPKSALITKVSKEGQSCKDTCYNEGLVCEPEFFSLLNSEEAFIKNDLHCSDIATEHSLHGPSINSGGHCSLQEHQLLLSCVGSEASTKRLCPCRTFKKGQVALCSECVR